jgi:hypothetical protein
MRFARGDVRETTSFHTKAATDLRTGTKERCSSREGLESRFARFSVPFNFRLFQQYRGKADLAVTSADFRN